MIADKTGNDSVFTLYLALDLDPGESYFASKNSEHFFYTPVRSGLTAIGPVPRGGERQTIEEWLKKFFLYTTYEISCPVMRDSSLAPPGKTGLIVSVLFDYRLTKHVEDAGWYEEFKTLCEKCIINTLGCVHLSWYQGRHFAQVFIHSGDDRKDKRKHRRRYCWLGLHE